MALQSPLISGTLDDRDRLAVETLYRAFSEQDPGLLDHARADDWQDIPLPPGQGPGREAMKPMIGAFGSAFPDAKVTIVEFIAAPGRVAVRAEITATHRGAWFGVAPTGRTFTLPIHEFHHLADGRITHTWHMEDWFGWLQQMSATDERAQEVAA
jgi:steroid delta-isomerase-like uncharacterized protein